MGQMSIGKIDQICPSYETENEFGFTFGRGTYNTLSSNVCSLPLQLSFPLWVASNGILGITVCVIYAPISLAYAPQFCRFNFGDQKTGMKNVGIIVIIIDW